MKQLLVISLVGILGGCASPYHLSAVTQAPRNDCGNKTIHSDHINRELAYTRSIPFLQKEHNEKIFALKDTYWALQYNCNPIESNSLHNSNDRNRSNAVSRKL